MPDFPGTEGRGKLNNLSVLFIHFLPMADGFGPDYFEQLDSERRVVRKRMGQPYATRW